MEGCNKPVKTPAAMMQGQGQLLLHHSSRRKVP